MIYLVILLLIGSFVLFLVSYRYFSKPNRLLKLCTEETTGELKGLQSGVKYTAIASPEISINSEPSPYVYYNVNGKEYKTHYTVQILKIGFDNKVKTKYDVTPGKLVIKYNRYNPSISYIVGDDLSGNKFFGYIYLICGIVFLISSLLIFVKF